MPLQTARADVGVFTMLVPGCEQAINRLYTAIETHHGRGGVFAVLDGKFEPRLPPWVIKIHAPTGPVGIVRPTKYAVGFLSSKYRWLLRLTWDAELLANHNLNLNDNCFYGAVRRNGSNLTAEPLRQLGVSKGTVEFDYIDGYAMLATSNWWKDVYVKLPETVAHYCDDSVSSRYGAHLGFHMCHTHLARHRHTEWRQSE